MIFRINTGAEVTVTLEKAYTKIGSPELKPLDKMLKHPSNDRLACKGRFMVYIQTSDVTIKAKIYVIKNRYQLLLGRPAIRGLNLLRRVSSVKQEQLVLEHFPLCFRVLVSLKESMQLSFRIT